MPLLVYLMAYLIRRRLDVSGKLNADDWFRALFQRFAGNSSDDQSSIAPGLVLVFGASLVLFYADWFSTIRGLGIVMHPLELVVLIALMGTPGWRSLLKAYSEAWQRGDMQAAWHHVKDQLPASERGNASSPEAMHLALCGRFMTEVFERYFLIAFWYVVGGIGFALFARGVVALRDYWPHGMARHRFALLAELLSWIPVRLLSFSFGLVGDLSGWLREGRRYLLTPAVSADAVLMAGASSALTGYALDPQRFAGLHPDDWTDFGGRSLRAIRDLLNRSMLVWICILALLVIAGIV